MIEYRRELFGLYSLGRIHGSAVSKAQVPAIFSTLVLIVVVYGFDLDINDNDSNRVINHPYCIQVLVVFMTFLITFRANFAYQRVSCVVQETGRQAGRQPTAIIMQYKRFVLTLRFAENFLSI